MNKRLNLFKNLRFRHSLTNCKGFTLIELLIGGILSLTIVTAAFMFYVNQHNQWLAQSEISSMQQNLRVGMNQLSTQLRLTGANLPSGFSTITAKNTNPDTVTIRYANYGCVIDVGNNTSNSSATPVQVSRTIDISGFAIGQKVYIWRPSNNVGEWFTITNIVDNVGTGWKEIYHGSATLNANPQIGDKLMVLNEFKYYLDLTDNAHPRLMFSSQGAAGIEIAEDLEDLQFVYTLNTGATTSNPASTDSVKSVNVYLRSKTTNKDVQYTGNSGFRQRDLTSDVFLRNL